MTITFYHVKSKHLLKRWLVSFDNSRVVVYHFDAYIVCFITGISHV